MIKKKIIIPIIIIAFFIPFFIAYSWYLYSHNYYSSIIGNPQTIYYSDYHNEFIINGNKLSFLVNDKKPLRKTNYPFEKCKISLLINNNIIIHKVAKHFPKDNSIIVIGNFNFDNNDEIYFHNFEDSEYNVLTYGYNHIVKTYSWYLTKLDVSSKFGYLVENHFAMGFISIFDWQSTISLLLLIIGSILTIVLILVIIYKYR